MRCNVGKADLCACAGEGDAGTIAKDRAIWKTADGSKREQEPAEKEQNVEIGEFGEELLGGR